MFDLKPLTRDAIPRALEKAERYRLLNEPAEAESICLDVLTIEPENQQALVLRLLALTDQFTDGLAPHRAYAQELLLRLASDYERAYYAGVIAEREGKAHLHHNGHSGRANATECFREAMEFYERAEHVRPVGNDDALLRWNACARQLERLPAQVEGEPFVPMLE